MILCYPYEDSWPATKFTLMFVEAMSTLRGHDLEACVEVATAL